MDKTKLNWNEVKRLSVNDLHELICQMEEENENDKRVRWREERDRRRAKQGQPQQPTERI